MVRPWTTAPGKLVSSLAPKIVDVDRVANLRYRRLFPDPSVLVIGNKQTVQRRHAQGRDAIQTGPARGIVVARNWKFADSIVGEHGDPKVDATHLVDASSI